MWNVYPANSLMPGIPGSLGRLSGPLAMAMIRAFMRSPRSVLMIQCPPASFHRSSVTLVWKQASS